jgi:dephospho-CoA kinase
MLIIGISGQTGAGKSTFANMLSARGLGENLEVDAVGHELLRRLEVKHALVAAFGSEILDDSGEVCRKSLGRRAFVNPDTIETLNSIMHPAMKRMVAERVDATRQAGKKAIIVNAALLFSMNLASLCNRLIYVQAEPEIRLRRLVNYRNWSEESARDRLFAQDSLPAAEGIILVNNDGDEADLERLADQVADNLLKGAAAA